MRRDVQRANGQLTQLFSSGADTVLRSVLVTIGVAPFAAIAFEARRQSLGRDRVGMDNVLASAHA